MAYGVRCFVLGDIKNEYAPLARALGVEPVELGPGLRARLNPLDAGPLGDHLPADADSLRERLAEIHRRRLTLLSSLLVMRLGRNLSPTEEAALSLAIHHASGQPHRRAGTSGWPGVLGSAPGQPHHPAGVEPAAGSAAGDGPGTACPLHRLGSPRPAAGARLGRR